MQLTPVQVQKMRTWMQVRAQRLRDSSYTTAAPSARPIRVTTQRVEEAQRKTFLRKVGARAAFALERQRKSSRVQRARPPVQPIPDRRRVESPIQFQSVRWGMARIRGTPRHAVSSRFQKCWLAQRLQKKECYGVRLRARPMARAMTQPRLPLRRRGRRFAWRVED